MSAFPDGEFRIYGNSDPTKILLFDCSAIQTASDYVITMPDLGSGHAAVTPAFIDAQQTWIGQQSFPTTLRVLDTITPTKTLGFSLLGATANKEVLLISSHTDNRSITLPDATTTLGGLAVASQVWTAANTFRAANAIRSEAASTQDAIVIAGRAGGSSSNAITITPDTLTGNRTQTALDSSGKIALAVNSAGSSAQDQTGKTGDISVTTIHTTTHAGFYRLDAYVVTTAVTVPGTIDLFVYWTDVTGAKSAQFDSFVYAAAGDDNQQTGGVGGGYPGSAKFYCTSGSNIRIETVTSGTKTYDAHFRVTDLG